ncbi:hypothetical protein ACF0AP_11285, partial [Acinetobacter baumannii]
LSSLGQPLPPIIEAQNNNLL